MTSLLIALAGFVGLLGMIWVGYPLIMAVAARLAGDELQVDHQAAASRSVSVVLATRESFDAVMARVSNLLDTDHPAALIQVVIARDASGDPAWADGFDFDDERVHVVAGDPPGGKATTLNAGVRAATGDVLILADTAQRYNRRTIPELVAALEDSRFGAVSGALELGNAGGGSPVHWYWRLEKWLRYSESRVHSSVGVTGAVYATRRTLWPQLPAGVLLDDVYVPMSLTLSGHRIGFCYKAQAWDVRTFASDAESARKTRTLTGVLQLLDVLPGILSSANPIRLQFVMHKLARLLTPLLMVGAVTTFAAATLLVALKFPTVVLSVGALLLLPIVAVPALRRRAMDAARWSFDMQRATTSALVNGARRNWSVWSAPR